MVEENLISGFYGMKKANFWAGGGLVLFAAACFGFQSSLVKKLLQLGSNPFQVLFYEFLIATLVLGVCIRAMRIPFDLTWRKALTVLAWGGVGVGGTGIGLYGAVERIPVALAIVLLFYYVPWVYLLEYLAWGIKPSRRRWIALGLILIGSVFATDVLAVSWDELDFVGIGLGLLGGVSYGTFIFASRKLGGIGTPLIRSFVICSGSGLIFGLGGLFASAFVFVPPEVNPTLFWGLILAVTFMGQIIPLISFSRAIPVIGGSMAAILASIELPVASFAAFFILGEQLRTVQWLGIFGIAVAIVIANWKLQETNV